jgi:microcystin-dependent protein
MNADSIAATATATSSTTIANTGGSQAFNIMQPYLGINYIIALVGVFPSRN